MKKINFVFKKIDYDNLPGNSSEDPAKINFDLIHDPRHASTFNLLKSFEAANLFYDDNIPEEPFFYEYEHLWWFSTEIFFCKGNGFLEKNPCPIHVLERIKNKTAFLVITIPGESFIQPNRLEIIQDYFNNLNLPESQIIYFICSPNGNEVYKKFCDKFNFEKKLNFEYFPFYPVNIPRSFDKNFTYIQTSNETKKDILMFNRRWGNHPHRVLFLYYLTKFNLLKNSYVSFSKKEVDNDESYTEHFNRFTKYLPDEIFDTNLLVEIENKLPLILDVEDLKYNELMYGKFEKTNNFYFDSFIHVVSETNFFDDIIHITEKTFKPIFYKQPFIILSTAGFLKKLKEMGFRTFGHLWDESYDDEIDDQKRFLKIINLIKNFCELPVSEKIKIYQDSKEIVEYNYDLLVNNSKHFILPLLEKYGNDTL